MFGKVNYINLILSEKHVFAKKIKIYSNLHEEPFILSQKSAERECLQLQKRSLRCDIHNQNAGIRNLLF